MNAPPMPSALAPEPTGLGDEAIWTNSPPAKTKFNWRDQSIMKKLNVRKCLCIVAHPRQEARNKLIADKLLS
jgi:hypothetical protein